MIQNVLVIVSFLLAAAWLVYYVRKNFTAKDSCAKSCSGCSTVDLNKIEEQIKKEGKFS